MDVSVEFAVYKNQCNCSQSQMSFSPSRIIQQNQCFYPTEAAFSDSADLLAGKSYHYAVMRQLTHSVKLVMPQGRGVGLVSLEYQEENKIGHFLGSSIRPNLVLIRLC